MLTPKQHALLTFIDGFMKRTGGVCPSFDEMINGTNIASKSSVHRFILELEKRGYIYRKPNHTRSLLILKGPNGEHRASKPEARHSKRSTPMSISERAYRLGQMMRTNACTDDDFEDVMEHVSDGLEGRAYAAVSA